MHNWSETELYSDKSELFSDKYSMTYVSMIPFIIVIVYES